MKTMIALCACALAACGGRDGMTTHPLVMIDADFAEDMPSVVRATNVWADAGVDMQPVIVAHDTLVTLAGLNGQDNTIYLVATRKEDQSDCPGEGRNVGDPGWTKVEHTNGSAVSCIYVPYVRANPSLNGTDQMVRTVGHELGHALGLWHLHDEDSLMRGVYDGVDRPGCEDYRTLATVRGTVVPKGCQ